MVERQAALLAFLDVFRILGVIVVVLTPLVLLMRRPRHRQDGPAAMGD